MHLTDITHVPFDFLDTFYRCHTIDRTELQGAYATWCAANNLRVADPDDGSFSAWLTQQMDQLDEESWMPIAIVRNAMMHLNSLIDVCAKHWQPGARLLPYSGRQTIVDERAGIIVFEDPELGDEAPLLVQFGLLSTSPCFQTDCYDPADIWQTLDLTVPTTKEN